MQLEEKKNLTMILPRIELGTLSVLDSRDNHYTTESTDKHRKEYCKDVAYQFTSLAS